MLKCPKRVVYRDISWSFEKHPNTGDIITITNEQAITQSIKTLVLLEINDLYQSRLGAGVIAYLFETLDSITALQLKNEITRVIESNEARIIPSSLKVSVFPDYVYNGFSVDITYTPTIRDIPVTVTMFLARIR
jgi:uncharacterized protein